MMPAEEDSLATGRAFFTGLCPDKMCQFKLVFPRGESIECTQCGQRFPMSKILNVQEVKNPEEELYNIAKTFLLQRVKRSKGPEDVRLLGLSNYVCKLLSPLLTHYGMDKHTGRAKLLTEMGQGRQFDCSVLGDRAFLIDPDHLDANGYGKDRTGSVIYLADTLDAIKKVNKNEERLVPIHSDGDGHCLVHAISRALVGRELFWHALRINLQNHFSTNLPKYKELLKDFVSENEWTDIIAECDPDFVPPETETHGLRNIHIFGLANVLHRPIILLDSLHGMDSSGDYSAVFLPVLTDVAKCRGKSGKLNPPLCIAWSNSGRNHFVPLVGIKGKELPHLPSIMIRRAWGVPTCLISQYMDLNDLGQCVVGGDNCLQEKYMQRLVAAMEGTFLEKYGVSPKLVADFHEEFYRINGIVGLKPMEAQHKTASLVQRRKLYQCLVCEGLSKTDWPLHWFMPGGDWYDLAIKTYGKLLNGKVYDIPGQGIQCRYDGKSNCLVDLETLTKCSHCRSSSVRRVIGDGTLEYRNGDRTFTPSPACKCGYKHHYDGKEYDSEPRELLVKFGWGGKHIEEIVLWFQNETDPSLNSNVFTLAQNVVQKHFPGEFGSERLVQKVVDILLQLTAIPEDPPAQSPRRQQEAEMEWSAESPTKIILTGQQQKSIHKEELTKSETEKAMRRRIEQNAPKQQQRHSHPSPQQTPTASPVRKQPPGSKPEPPKPSTIPPPAPRPTPAESRAMESSDSIRIKLVTSSGQQSQLELCKQTTYAELQQKVAAQSGIPPHRQRLRCGFPPKELHPPPQEAPDTPVPLQHGDKLTVEEVKPPASSNHTGVSSSETSLKMPWGMGEDAGHPAMDALMDVLKRSNLDLWAYAQTMPHFFSKGGIFYQLAEKSKELKDKSHLEFPYLPGKIFWFNAEAQRLELCMEPYGHFPIEPNVEHMAKVKHFSGASNRAGGHVKFGASGPLGKQSHDPTTAFKGHGHSLKNDIAMPADLLPLPQSHHHHGPRDPNDPDADLPQQSPILEDAEMEAEEEQSMPPAASQPHPHSYRKLGPGYSVLSQDVSNQVNHSAEAMRQLAEKIQLFTASHLDVIEEDREGSVEPPAVKADTRSSIGRQIDDQTGLLLDAPDSGIARTQANAEKPEAPTEEESGSGDGVMMQEVEMKASSDQEAAVLRESPQEEQSSGDVIQSECPAPVAMEPQAQQATSSEKAEAMDMS